MSKNISRKHSIADLKKRNFSLFIENACLKMKLATIGQRWISYEVCRLSAKNSPPEIRKMDEKILKDQLKEKLCEEIDNFEIDEIGLADYYKLILKIGIRKELLIGEALK